MYDTLTQKAGGTITGNAERKQDGFQGSVNVAGYTLPLNSLTKISEKPAPRYRATLGQEKYREDDLPLQFQFVEHDGPNHHFSGTLTRPSDKYGRLGFTLRTEPDYNAEAAVEANTPDEKWMNRDHSFSIPNQGIPTDTGSRRLVKILPSTGAKKGGDQK